MHRAMFSVVKDNAILKIRLRFEAYHRVVWQWVDHCSILREVKRNMSKKEDKKQQNIDVIIREQTNKLNRIVVASNTRGRNKTGWCWSWLEYCSWAPATRTFRRAVLMATVSSPRWSRPKMFCSIPLTPAYGTRDNVWTMEYMYTCGKKGTQ